MSNQWQSSTLNDLARAAGKRADDAIQEDLVGQIHAGFISLVSVGARREPIRRSTISDAIER